MNNKGKRLNFYTWIFILILWPNLLAGIAQAKDAAMVMSLSGRAFFETGENGKRPVRTADFLYPGTRIRLDGKTTIVLIYSAGGIREEITGSGTIRVGNSESEIEEKTIQAKRSEADYLPDGSVSRAGMDYGATVLREVSRKPDHQEIRIQSLCDTAIRSLTPVFRWQNIDSAETYRLNAFDDEYRQVFETITNKTTFMWKDTTGLNYGRAYRWTVTALSGEKVLSETEGGFSVSNKEQIIELENLEKMIKSKFPDDNPEGMISLALLYQSYELFDEAAEVLGRIRTKFPESETIGEWLNRVSCK